MTTTPSEVPHKASCQYPDPVRQIGNRGDRLERCRSCAGFRVLTDTDPTEAPERPRARPRTRYRCRDHEVPVNFRGKGCHECAQALTRKPRKRKAPTPNEVPSWLT